MSIGHIRRVVYASIRIWITAWATKSSLQDGCSTQSCIWMDVLGMDWQVVQVIHCIQTTYLWHVMTVPFWRASNVQSATNKCSLSTLTYVCSNLYVNFVFFDFYRFLIWEAIIIFRILRSSIANLDKLRRIFQKALKEGVVGEDFFSFWKRTISPQ